MAEKKGSEKIVVTKLNKIKISIVSLVIVVTAAVTIFFATPAFAADGTLNFIGSSPTDGGTNVPIENVGVKLFFDNNVTDYSVWTANSTAFTLTDPDGNKVEYDAYPGQKVGEEGYILVVKEEMVEFRRRYCVLHHFLHL